MHAYVHCTWKRVPYNITLTFLISLRTKLNLKTRHPTTNRFSSDLVCSCAGGKLRKTKSVNIPAHVSLMSKPVIYFPVKWVPQCTKSQNLWTIKTTTLTRTWVERKSTPKKCRRMKKIIKPMHSFGLRSIINMHHLCL